MTPEREQEIRDGYRLTKADLDRLVNSEPAATELSWAVKDLMLAHYELDELTSVRQEHERLKELKVFEAAFADKIGEFGTVERLIEEYSAMKQEHREQVTTGS